MSLTLSSLWDLRRSARSETEYELHHGKLEESTSKSTVVTPQFELGVCHPDLRFRESSDAEGGTGLHAGGKPAGRTGNQYPLGSAISLYRLSLDL